MLLKLSLKLTSLDQTSVLSIHQRSCFICFLKYYPLRRHFIQIAIGRLLYLIATRPDISFDVQQLSQFIASPTNIHLFAAHQILRFIKQATRLGLFLPIEKNLKLTSFSYSDWTSTPHSPPPPPPTPSQPSKELSLASASSWDASLTSWK